MFALTVGLVCDTFTALRALAAFQAVHYNHLRRLQVDDILPHSAHWPHIGTLELIGRDTVHQVRQGLRYLAIRISANQWDVRHVSGSAVSPNITARLGLLATPDVLRLFWITAMTEAARPQAVAIAAATSNPTIPPVTATVSAPAAFAPAIRTSQYVAASPVVTPAAAKEPIHPKPRESAPTKPLTPTQREFEQPIRRDSSRRIPSNSSLRLQG